MASAAFARISRLQKHIAPSKMAPIWTIPVSGKQKDPLKVAIGSLGSIGIVVAKALDAGTIPGLKLVAVSARDYQKAERNMKNFNQQVPILPLEELASCADIVVECAPAAVFDRVVIPACKAGRIITIVTCGPLLKKPEVLKLAEENGAKIIICTGALLGLDAVRGAAEGTINSVTMITRKPPTGLKGAPHLEKNNISVDNLTEPLKVFEGNAYAAAEAFPANINVGVALSLAGLGPDKTKIEIWADPAVTRNTHRIEVDSDATRFQMAIQGVPDPANPKTGKLTALSVITTLRRITATMTVGS